MTVCRMFTMKEVSKHAAMANAFKTGKFEPEIIDYLNKHHLETVLSYLPKCTNFITLSPDILALNQQKLAELFKFLPDHVKAVHFEMANLKDTQLPRFKGLMAHSGYAINATAFNFQWDFHRYSMTVLEDNVFAKAIPRQLNSFNFVHGPGIERVVFSDIKRFADTKLGSDTEVACDTHYHLRQRCG